MYLDGGRARPVSRATTRARGGTPAAWRTRLLEIGQVVTSPETRLQYRIERLLGGAASARSISPPARALVDRARDGLHQGQPAHRRLAARGVLRPAARRPSARDPRLRRVPADARRTAASLYCLALEYARHGDLSAFLQRAGKGWPETAARREIAGILEVLGKLHRGQLLHRDLTPLNVFVCDGRRLKLGDFGIVRQQSDRRGITARTMNALTAPSDILAGAAPKWQARDDVYQVGQLLGMLVKGDARARIRTADVRAPAVQRSPEGDHLPLHRRAAQALRERRRADRRAAQPARRRSRPACCASLKGVHLAFTGILSRRAREAAKAARARRRDRPRRRRRRRRPSSCAGRPNAQQAAGRDGGLKLMEIKRLREKGHRITLLNEAQFWKLAGTHRPDNIKTIK